MKDLEKLIVINQTKREFIQFFPSIYHPLEISIPLFRLSVYYSKYF